MAVKKSIGRWAIVLILLIAVIIIADWLVHRYRHQKRIQEQHSEQPTTIK
jgi:flagellar biogenesis protein FliO